ncbi:VWA domain-containing protein [Kiritimatiellaeota bacterium B1221]|nr:VWA domain-containing protein [Kiritimatiellaeota bacterium B1221]
MNAKLSKWSLLFGLGIITQLVAAPQSAEDQLIKCKVELDRGVLPADQKQTAVVKISLVADAAPKEADRPPVNLCIVMDRSGSMSGNKIEQARQAALEALSRLGSQDIFSLVMYGSDVTTLIPAGRVKDQRRAQELIRGIQTHGNTALFGGVSQGAAELRKAFGDHAEGMVHRMILLSDGLANKGPSSPEDLGRLGVSLQKEGISVSTIGVGNDYNEDLMTRLAQRSDGNTYFVENENDLARIFGQELGDVLNVVARNIRIQIECPENVKPLRSIGREATIRGQKVELNLNQLYGSQERYLLLEVEVPSTPADTELPLVSAAIQYRNLFTEVDEQQNLALNAQFSRQEAEVKASTNVDVKEEVLLNESAMAKEEAIKLAEQGNQKAAVQVLKKNRQQILDATVNFEFSAPEALEEEAQNLEAQSIMLDQDGLNSYNRKVLRTDAQQTRNQQLNKSSWKKK